MSMTFRREYQILPSIRTERLPKLYESILTSTKRNFELVICGPNALPEELRDLRNVKYIKDYGSPVRASNIAAGACEGDVYTWLADDCLFFENSLDECLDRFYAMGDAKNNVLVAKYFEGQEGSSERETLQPDSYFKIVNTPAGTEQTYRWPKFHYLYVTICPAVLAITCQSSYVSINMTSHFYKANIVTLTGQ